MVYFSFIRYIMVRAFVLSSISGTLLGQALGQKNDIKIRCSLVEIVKDNSDLNLKLVLANLGHSSQTVYRGYIEGGFDASFFKNISNFKLIIQVNNLTKYQPYFNKVSIDPAPGSDTQDRRLKKVTLGPNDSLVSNFHVDELYKFVPGHYRLKCLYWNDINVNNSVETNWIYFRVEKTIYVKHYFNEHSARM